MMKDKYQSSCPRPWGWPLGCPANEIQVVSGDNILYSVEAEVVYKDGWPSVSDAQVTSEAHSLS
jgi:hypothetical protein